MTSQHYPCPCRRLDEELAQHEVVAITGLSRRDSAEVVQKRQPRAVDEGKDT